MGSRWSSCSRELEDVCCASCRQMQALPSQNREADWDVKCTPLVAPEAAQWVPLSCCPASSHFSMVMTESCSIASMPSSVSDFLARQSTWTAHAKHKMGQLQPARCKQTKGMQVGLLITKAGVFKSKEKQKVNSANNRITVNSVS